MDAVTLHETEDLNLVEKMAGDHPHVNDPASHPGAKTHYLAVRQEDGEVIGTGWTRVIAGKIGVAGGLYIKEPYRGQGLGEKAFDCLMERLRRQGCTVVVVGVHRDNTPSRALLRKKGFRTILPWIPGIDKDSRLAGIIGSIAHTPPPPRATKIMARMI